MRVVQHRTIAPVGAVVHRLPEIVDAVGLLADQKRLQVLLHGRHNQIGALRESAAPISIEPVLIGDHLDHDQPQHRRVAVIT